MGPRLCRDGSEKKEQEQLNLGVSFSPLVPAYIVWVAAAVAFALSLLLVFGRTRGALIRTIALALFVLALANPSITREDREPLTSVAVVVVDKSPSQEFGDRTKQTEAARAALAERLGRMASAEEHASELQSLRPLVCRILLDNKDRRVCDEDCIG